MSATVSPPQLDVGFPAADDDAERAKRHEDDVDLRLSVEGAAKAG